MAEEIKLHKVTEEGLKAYQEEYANLIEEKEANKIALEEARALGDLSENADYDYARKEQRRINDRIDLIKDILKYHEIIKETWITVEFVDSKIKKTFRLVGILEADPSANMISSESPIGKAVAGRKVGDVVTFQSGTGKEITVKIIEGNI